MKRVELLNQRESPASSVSNGEKKLCTQEKQEKKQKRKRNSCPLSYIEVIAYAILSSPYKRCTLSEIYSFIEDKYPEFTENRVRWKNTVRHNLSLHECFERGEIALDRIGCYWSIHPSFVADFSRGDFSRRRPIEAPPNVLDGGYHSFEHPLHVPGLAFRWNIFPPSSSAFTPHVWMLELQLYRRGLHVPFGHHPYFFWNPYMHWAEPEGARSSLRAEDAEK